MAKYRNIHMFGKTIRLKEGALREQAARAGMTVAEFCAKPHKDPTIIRRCNLYRIFMAAAKKRRKARV